MLLHGCRLCPRLPLCEMLTLSRGRQGKVGRHIASRKDLIKIYFKKIKNGKIGKGLSCWRSSEVVLLVFVLLEKR